MPGHIDGILGRVYRRVGDEVYCFARFLIGFLFALHGAQKLLGVLTDRGPVEIGSLLFFASIIELIGGALIALGIGTRLAASITTIEMLVAYFKVHLPRSAFPVERGGGEIPLLFIAAFILLAVYGSGSWGLERMLTKKELF